MSCTDQSECITCRSENINRYVAASSHMRKWKPTSRQKVLAYLGIWVIIGLVPCPKYRKCWSNNRVLQHDIIAEVMSMHRFDQVTPFHPRGGSSSIPGEQDIEAAINRRILKYSFASTFVPEDIVTASRCGNSVGY